MNEIAEYCKQIRSCCAELSAFLRTTNELVRLAETVNSHIDWPRHERKPWQLNDAQVVWCEKLGVRAGDAEALGKRAYEQKAALREKLARRLR